MRSKWQFQILIIDCYCANYVKENTQGLFLSNVHIKVSSHVDNSRKKNKVERKIWKALIGKRQEAAKRRKTTHTKVSISSRRLLLFLIFPFSSVLTNKLRLKTWCWAERVQNLIWWTAFFCREYEKETKSLILILSVNARNFFFSLAQMNRFCSPENHVRNQLWRSEKKANVWNWPKTVSRLIERNLHNASQLYWSVD